MREKILVTAYGCSNRSNKVGWENLSWHKHRSKHRFCYMAKAGTTEHLNMLFFGKICVWRYVFAVLFAWVMTQTPRFHALLHGNRWTAGSTVSWTGKGKRIEERGGGGSSYALARLPLLLLLSFRNVWWTHCCPVPLDVPVEVYGGNEVRKVWILYCYFIAKCDSILHVSQPEQQQQATRLEQQTCNINLKQLFCQLFLASMCTAEDNTL